MALTAQEWVFSVVACPKDRTSLRRNGDRLVCALDHEFPVVEEIPVLIVETEHATHPYCEQTLSSLRALPPPPATSAGVDPFVQAEIVKTNGNLYRDLLGRLPRYPIPDLRMLPGGGRSLLDVGCNWGRWTIAAARAGYRAVGVDPWIEAARAGRRVARQLGLDIAFVVGDARHLPFRDGSFECCFSYSVLQHFDKQAARDSLMEMSRVAQEGGTIKVQMPNVLGLRQAINRLRQAARPSSDPFRVRYWNPRELRRTFEKCIGPTRLEVDGFFSLNAQRSDLDLLPPSMARVVRASEFLRALSPGVNGIGLFADSLYATSENRKARTAAH